MYIAQMVVVMRPFSFSLNTAFLVEYIRTNFSAHYDSSQHTTAKYYHSAAFSLCDFSI